MRCPSCSTENPDGAAFCQHCGVALAAAPPPAGYTQVPQPAAGPGGAAYVPTHAGLTDNVAGAVAYLTFIPAIIFLILEPYNRRPFVRFHAFQCLALTVASVILHFAVGLMAVFLHGLTFMLSSLVSLVFFILWLIAIVNAAQGKMWKAPFLGDFAEQQANR